jgi:hypothetical protein
MQDAVNFTEADLRSELVDLRTELLSKIGALELKLRPNPAQRAGPDVLLEQLIVVISGLRTELLDKISTLELKMEPQPSRPYYDAAWSGSAYTAQTGPSVTDRASALQATQAASSMRVRTKGCSSVLLPLRNALGAHCSFEDIEGLVGNLILFDTFLFGFSVTLMTGTFSHDDLLEADTRSWILEQGCYTSHRFLYTAMVSSLLLVCSLLLGLMLALSLGFSDCRERQSSFERWLVLGRPATCLAYLMFIAGFGLFFMASAVAVVMIFPRYPMSPKVGAQFCFPDEGSLRFNSGAGTLITLQTRNDTLLGGDLNEWWYFIHPDSAEGRYFGLAWILAMRTFSFSQAMLIIIGALGVVGIVAFNLVDARKSAAECARQDASGS